MEKSVLPHGAALLTGRGRGFTLVELLLSMALVSLLMLVLVDAVTVTDSVWRRERSRLSAFKEARGAVETMSRRLAEATLDSCWAYGKDAAGNDAYVRSSDGHFVSGPSSGLLAQTQLPGHAVFFQAPYGYSGHDSAAAPLAGMDSLLNCLGYYVDYQSDLPGRPSFLAEKAQQMANPERRRFRLVEFRQPAEKMILFSDALALNSAATTRDEAYAWFRGPFKDGATLASCSMVVAENILALIIQPEWLDTDAVNNTTVSRPVEDFYYDTREVQWGGTSAKAKASQHQLPPRVRMSLIATDEKSYQTLENRMGAEAAAEAVRGIFKNRFLSNDTFTKDLEEVEQGLVALRLEHRVFSTSIALRGSKWIIETTL